MFIVTEIQTVNDQISTITNQFATLNEADNKYHTVLAAAAVSPVPVHSCVLLDEAGNRLKGETYYHCAE